MVVLILLNIIDNTVATLLEHYWTKLLHNISLAARDRIDRTVHA